MASSKVTCWFVSGPTADEWSPLFPSPELAEAHAQRLGYRGYAVLLVDGSPSELRTLAARRHSERLSGNSA